MTKTRARQVAKQARRHGYFDKGATLEVTCPECHQRVSIAYSVWAGTKTAQLDAGMLFHLDGFCGEET